MFLFGAVCVMDDNVFNVNVNVCVRVCVCVCACALVTICLLVLFKFLVRKVAHTPDFSSFFWRNSYPKWSFRTTHKLRKIVNLMSFLPPEAFMLTLAQAKSTWCVSCAQQNYCLDLMLSTKIQTMDTFQSRTIHGWWRVSRFFQNRFRVHDSDGCKTCTFCLLSQKSLRIWSFPASRWVRFALLHQTHYSSFTSASILLDFGSYRTVLLALAQRSGAHTPTKPNVVLETHYFRTHNNRNKTTTTETLLRSFETKPWVRSIMFPAVSLQNVHQRNADTIHKLCEKTMEPEREREREKLSPQDERTHLFIEVAH